LRGQIFVVGRRDARGKDFAFARTQRNAALAEEIDAVRDIILAKETGARIHIAHVSTRGAIEAVGGRKMRV
jgi:dihydroorotase-like cyclic amidohydrolase